MNIAINGFGRIGKNFLRTVLQDTSCRKKLNVVAINLGPASKESAAHLFQYDTMMGTFTGSVSLEGDDLVVDGQHIRLLNELEPSKLPWKNLGVDWVVDCSGTCTKRARAEQHLQAGAKRVLISAPCTDEDVTIIPGVNDNQLNLKKDKIISLGSCTTNALVPMVKVLKDDLGFEQGFMTTIHAYTNSQVLLDVEHKDLRRARAAALNIIPTTTGATKTLTKIYPDLADKIKGMAIRVPVAKVSLIDMAFSSSRALDAKNINSAFKRASETYLRGIMGCTEEELVSSDFSGSPFSVVIDLPLTQAMGRSGKLFGWYDNEWGYSERLKDFLCQSDS